MTAPVALTEAGRRRFDEPAAEHDTRRDTPFAGVSDGDVDALEALLQRLTSGKAAR